MYVVLPPVLARFDVHCSTPLIIGLLDLFYSMTCVGEISFSSQSKVVVSRVISLCVHFVMFNFMLPPSSPFILVLSY